MTQRLSLRLNTIGLLAIVAVLAFALGDQLLYKDLPCPLCILQRVGFVLAGFGLALNLRFSPHPSHYALTILGALFGGRSRSGRFSCISCRAAVPMATRSWSCTSIRGR